VVTATAELGVRERGRRGEGFGVLIHRVPRIEFVRELEFVFDAAEGAEEELADVGERDAVRAEMRFARRRCGGGRGRGSWRMAERRASRGRIALSQLVKYYVRNTYARRGFDQFVAGRPAGGKTERPWPQESLLAMDGKLLWTAMIEVN